MKIVQKYTIKSYKTQAADNRTLSASEKTVSRTKGGWRRGVVVSGVRRMNEVNAR